MPTTSPALAEKVTPSMARSSPYHFVRSMTRNGGGKFSPDGKSAESMQRLLALLYPATAIDDEGHVLTVFRRLDGNAFSGGFDVADLRITCRLQLGHKLVMGQGMSRREGASHHKTAK